MASRQLVRVRGELREHVERAVRQLQLRAFQALVSASPVDTGFFRAGWVASLGAPNHDGPAEPPPGGRAAVEAKAAELRTAREQGARATSESYVLAAGTAHVSNVVHYGVYLNEGSSAQAPARFVEQAVAEAVAATRRSLR